MIHFRPMLYSTSTDTSYSVSIQSKCGKIRTRKTQNTDTFHQLFWQSVLSQSLFSHQKDDLKYNLSQYLTPVESTLEISLLKFWSMKSFPGEKRFIWFTSPTFLHNLLHPWENIKLLTVPSRFLTFTPIRSDINLVILLSLWCAVASPRACGNLW